MSLSFLAALTESLAHCLSNHSRKTVGQRGEFGIHAADFPFEAVDLLYQSLQIDTVKLLFDCHQIVAVAPALLKNVSRHHLLALDLAFEHAYASFELFSGHVCRHG